MTPLGPQSQVLLLFVHMAVPACWLICFSNCPGGWESFTTSESPQKAGTWAAQLAAPRTDGQMDKVEVTYGGPDRLSKSCC